jgi:hypothetical protein
VAKTKLHTAARKTCRKRGDQRAPGGALSTAPRAPAGIPVEGPLFCPATPQKLAVTQFPDPAWPRRLCGSRRCWRRPRS